RGLADTILVHKVAAMAAKGASLEDAENFGTNGVVCYEWVFHGESPSSRNLEQKMVDIIIIQDSDRISNPKKINLLTSLNMHG
ncbi:6845_t:CDS:2, partial [Funneliformis geosporum]